MSHGRYRTFEKKALHVVSDVTPLAISAGLGICIYRITGGGINELAAMTEGIPVLHGMISGANPAVPYLLGAAAGAFGFFKVGAREAEWIDNQISSNPRYNR